MVAHAEAELIFSESFEYETVTEGESVADLGQPDSADPSGTGWTSDWEGNGPYYYADGLEYAGIPSAGGKGRNWSNWNNGRHWDMTGLTDDGQMQYGRFLVDFNGTAPNDGNIRMLFHSTGSSTSGLGVEFESDPEDETMGLIKARMTGNVASDGIPFSLTGTHLVVLKFTWDATDQVDVWVDPADFGDLGTAGSSLSGDAENTNNGVGDEIYPRAQGMEWDIDEIAMGETLTDVSIPEPTTMALLGLGGLAVLRRRKK
jgi:hypothetical protein